MNLSKDGGCGAVLEGYVFLSKVVNDRGLQLRHQVGCFLDVCR